MARPRGKLSKGQPRGARSASGRKRALVAQRELAVVTPCEGVQRRRELFRLPANDVGEAEAGDRKARRGRQETATHDAIGRAYCAGLLGKGEQAERLLQAGRRVHAHYWRHFGTTTQDSLAKWQPRIGGGVPDPEEDRRIENALNVSLKAVNERGRAVRSAFDQLVVDMNFDQGPMWLDAIVWAHRHHREPSARDVGLLRQAIEGLEAVV